MVGALLMETEQSAGEDIWPNLWSNTQRQPKMCLAACSVP